MTRYQITPRSRSNTLRAAAAALRDTPRGGGTAWILDGSCTRGDAALLPWCARTRHDTRAGDGRPPQGPVLRLITVCVGCAVTVECLRFAMDAEAHAETYVRYGVFGGLTPGQRGMLADTMREEGTL